MSNVWIFVCAGVPGKEEATATKLQAVDKAQSTCDDAKDTYEKVCIFYRLSTPLLQRNRNITYAHTVCYVTPLVLVY